MQLEIVNYLTISDDIYKVFLDFSSNSLLHL